MLLKTMGKTKNDLEIKLGRPLNGDFAPRREFEVLSPPIVGRLVLRAESTLGGGERHIPFIETKVPWAAECQLAPIEGTGHQFLVNRERCLKAIREGLGNLSGNFISLNATYDEATYS